MSLGLEVAILPGLALARRLDTDGDWKCGLGCVVRERELCRGCGVRVPCAV